MHDIKDTTQLNSNNALFPYVMVDTSELTNKALLHVYEALLKLYGALLTCLMAVHAHTHMHIHIHIYQSPQFPSIYMRAPVKGQYLYTITSFY